MTLREVCAACGVTRRAVQGYERIGLVRPFGKTGSGYLLYDEERQSRIADIKRWQDIGFSLMEIKELIDAPQEVKRCALELQIHKLQEQRKRIAELIEMAKEMMNLK